MADRVILSEAAHIAMLLPPQNITGASSAAPINPCFSMKQYKHASVLVLFGAEGTQEATTLLVYLCTSAAGGTPVAIPFNCYFQAAGCGPCNGPRGFRFVSSNLIQRKRQSSMPGPEIFAFGFQVMGAWDDSVTLRRKTWVRCFSTDQEGRQAGRAFSRIFDPIEFLLFECRREFRTAIVREPRREQSGGILLETAGEWDRCCGYWFCVHEKLTHDDRSRIAEIVRSGTTEEENE